MPCLTVFLHVFSPRSCFFLPRPAEKNFNAADVQRDSTIPSSVLLAPPVSSPCLDVDEEIGLKGIGSPSYWSLILCQTN